MGATFIQESTPAAQGPVTNPAFTVNAAANGNVLVVFVFAFNGTGGVPSVSSLSQTNVTWVKVTATSASYTNRKLECWYGTVAGGSSGTTLTVNFSASATHSVIELTEWSGVIVPISVDSFGSGLTNASTNQIVSNNVTQATTTSIDDLIVTAGAWNSLTTTITAQPSGYSNLSKVTDANNNSIQVNYKLTSSVGNQSPSWTLSVTAVTLDAAIVVCLRATKFSTLTDSTTISDSILKSGARNLADSITQVESFVKQTYRTLIDNIQIYISDAIYSEPILLLIDTFTLVDTIVSRALTRLLTDSITLLDLLTKLPSKIYLESFNLIDYFGKAASKILAELISVTEQFNPRRIFEYALNYFRRYILDTPIVEGSLSSYVEATVPTDYAINYFRKYMLDLRGTVVDSMLNFPTEVQVSTDSSILYYRQYLGKV